MVRPDRSTVCGVVTIPSQFNGPPRSGNGGWVCGLLAEEWSRRNGADVVTSTLLQPPPLDTALTWEADDAELRLLTQGGAVIGTATAGSFDDDAPSVVSHEEAVAGEAAYPGLHSHPFAHCFTCGPAREPGDGLRVFSGPIDDGRTGALWNVDDAFGDDAGQVSEPVTWAALDCPGGWTAGYPDDILLLGRMTAEVLRAPMVGETLMATGWLRAVERRKRLTSTALFTDAGELVGRSEQIWISMP